MSLTEKKIKQLSDEINRIKTFVNNSVAMLHHYSAEDEYQGNQEHEDQEQLIWSLRNLYKHVLVYLEARGFLDYRNDFKTEFDPVMKDKDKLLKIESWLGDGYSVVLGEINRYLKPFEAIEDQFKKGERDHEIDRLANILEATPQILLKTNTDATNETKINEALRWVINLYYPNAKSLRGAANFIGNFKKYNPDLIVPELSTAIECKLVRDKKVIDDYLDEIVIDAKNYVGDERYTNFMAVLCLVRNSVTKNVIKAGWESKKFPNTWQLIIVNVT